MNCRRAIGLVALLLAAACLVACTWRKQGKFGSPEFKRTSVQIPLRATSGPVEDAGVAIAYHDGSLTKVSTAFGLDECSYAFRVRLKNVGDVPNERFRGPAVEVLDTRGGSKRLSGPIGCGNSILAPGTECLATFYSHVPARNCTDPAALVVGQARIVVSP